MPLNTFRGGPVDGEVHETSFMLSTAGLSIPIRDYRWTTEVETQPDTGKEIRVWMHVSLMPDPEPRQAETSSLKEKRVSKQEGSTAVKTPAAPKETPPINELGIRRTALKISRNAAATGMGITTSAVWRIEHDGPKTTDEERAKYNEFLAGQTAPGADLTNGATPTVTPTDDLDADDDQDEGEDDEDSSQE